MTDRRRNLFVLLLVAGLLVGVAGGHRRRKPTRLGLDLKGGVSLIYQAKPTKQSQVTGDAIDRSLDIMRKRVDQLGVAEPEIQRSGADQIDVALPDVKNADEARRAGRHHRPAVLLRLGGQRPRAGLQARPAEPERHRRAGGRRRQHRAALSLLRRGHARRASARATNTGKDDRRATSSTSSTRRPRRSSPGPTRARADLQQEAAQQEGHRSTPSRSSRSRRAPSSSAPSSADAKGKPPTGLVRPQATSRSLGGTDIKNPEQNFDNGPGGSGQPNVTFDFTGKGRERVAEGHAQASPSAARSSALRRRPRDASTSTSRSCSTTSSISVPYIDFQQNPDGIDGAQRLADLGRLHDQVRPGPGQPAEDRRPADQARADLARRRSRPRSASRR